MKHKFFYLVFFGILLSIFRLIPHPPNFTPILACAIMAPLLIKDRIIGISIPVIAMFIGDVIIGFHPFQFVTYSTLLIISLVSPMKKNYLILGIMTLGGSVWFFITTNFAVWILLDYYPKTFEGLLTSYTLAIPFFKNTLISTCLFTGLLTISINYLETVNEKINNFSFRFFKNIPTIKR